MILCCGEALVDMLPRTDGHGLAPILGGSVFNTARALGRLGVKTGFLSGISTDPFGDDLSEALHQSHVDTRFCVRGDGLTTLAFVHLENGNASYRFYDENSAGRMIYPENFPPISNEISTMFFGGISLCFDPAASTYRDICLANADSKLTMIDPNLRPDFVADKKAYLNRLNEMIAACDIVKVSNEDLDLLISTSQSEIEKLKSIKALGPSIVILTKGGQGALALTPSGEIVTATAPKVDVSDTIGAGDTFNAGFLAMLEASGLLCKAAIGGISAANVQKSLAYGVKAAAIVVTRSGANPPWQSEIANL